MKTILILLMSIMMIGLVSGEINLFLQDANTENLGDTYIKSEDATGNFASETDMRIQNDTNENFHRFAYIKFNITELISIADKISLVSCELGLFMQSEGVDPGESVNISIKHVFNQSWSEASLDFNTQFVGTQINNTPFNITEFEDGDALEFKFFDCKIPLQAELTNLNNNFSFGLIPEVAVGTTTPDQVRFTTKEGATVANRPFLNITYLDLSFPSITLNAPLNKTFNSESLFFNITVTDDISGVDTCILSLDNGLNNNTMTNTSTAPDDYTFTNSTMLRGTYNVTYYCNDTANNLNDTEIQPFVIRWGGNLINQIKLVEGTGNTFHGRNFTGVFGTFTSAISGATWANDGIDITLTENTDYNITGDEFRVADQDLSFTQIELSYNYNVLGTAKSAINKTEFGLGTMADFWEIIVLAVVIAVIIGLLISIFGISTIGGRR